MIVVVAHASDPSAQAFAGRWAAHNVHVLTSQDLSVSGWRQSLNSAADGCTAVVGGALVPQSEITGVLTRRLYVSEEELLDIAREDRPYVAAEMTAFLWFWLSRLQCPVLNRPTTAGMLGPFWWPETWVRVAAQAGIPVRHVHRRASLLVSAPERDSELSPTTLTVVGDLVLGEAAEELQNQARCLARLAKVELLAVRFSSPEFGARFLDADIYPDLSDDRVSEAVLLYLERVAENCAPRMLA